MKINVCKPSNHRQTKRPKITSILEQLDLISAYYGKYRKTKLIYASYYIFLIVIFYWTILLKKLRDSKSDWLHVLLVIPKQDYL